MAEIKLCSVDGCGKKRHANGYCATHNARMKYYGRLTLIRRENGSKNHCGQDDCPAANRLHCALYKLQHGDVVRAGQRRHYEANKQAYIDRANRQPKEKRSQYREKWNAAHPETRHLHSKKRRKQQKHAAPTWLTKDQWWEMEAFYQKARALTKETGTEYEVDHIVPLAGKTVCGLHVPWNLRVITATANASRPRVWWGVDTCTEGANSRL